MITISQTEKSKPKHGRKEEQLYEPILNALKKIFKVYLNSYIESVKKRMTEPLPFNLKDELEKTCIHLEITTKGHFSEKLKEQLNDKALGIIRVEKFSPDIMGLMRKGIPSSSTELITVEAKAEKITIKNISRAKLYKDIFKAHYGMRARRNIKKSTKCLKKQENYSNRLLNLRSFATYSQTRKNLTNSDFIVSYILLLFQSFERCMKNRMSLPM